MMDGWSDEEIRAYDNCKFRRSQSKRQNRLLGAMDASTLETELPQTDFWNEEQVAIFKPKLNSLIFTYHSLGMYERYHYRLKPALEQLKPTFDVGDLDPRDRTLLPLNTLGIHFNNMDSDQSVSSTGSMNDDTGFVFVQLGRLEYTRTINQEAPMKSQWKRTGYIVIPIIEVSGFAKNIWILWNFNDEEEDAGASANWGYLPEDSVQRAAVLIASKYKDLQPDRAIDVSVE
jgi:hypothetical protein